MTSAYFVDFVAGWVEVFSLVFLCSYSFDTVKVQQNFSTSFPVVTRETFKDKGSTEALIKLLNGTYLNVPYVGKDKRTFFYKLVQFYLSDYVQSIETIRM
ncbi:hypothetical protein ABEB36_003399 [Hypothenemus hampei]|uniref:Uncharacterized protein n=1 Tax=Hypothenemus hampei TaxID=57062 RepID=A0ABD1FCM4_HYPHA